MIDGIKFLNKYLINNLSLPYFIKSPFWRKIAWRVLAVSAYKKRELTTKELFESFLPSRFQSSMISERLFRLMRERINNIFLKGHLYEDDFVNLFNKPFYPAQEGNLLDSFLRMLLLFHQILICDQYAPKKFLKDNSIVIDVGANIGVFSVYAANLCSNGKVYSFEPRREAYEALFKNVSLYDNIEIFNLAVGNEDGKVKLLLSENVASSTVIYDSRNEDSLKTSIVEMTSLDSFVFRNHLPKIDFIKIDTAGNEIKIIEGAKEVIKKYSPTLSISVYEDYNKIFDLIHKINPLYKAKKLRKFEDVGLFYVN